ncbi:carbohydrate esterase family 10 protein [Ceratobasidium sp. AG-Ba]|nr:carbohydrate esterase family 10 protein [Ceratobasidium sp. AG-Ba]
MSTTNGPIHPDIRPLLDPEYVDFYEKHIANRTALHRVPWDPACRVGPINLGGLEPCKVGSVKDIVISLPGRVSVPARVFTPEGDRPEGGWPVLAYYHGGGWVLGNIDTENSFSARTCKAAKCVVVSVDFRLAPEHVFPAAVDDSWTALEWIYEHGAKELGINPAKIAVGGSSAGGNLSAVLTQRAAQRSPPIPIVYQVLIVPVIDNAIKEDGTSPLPAFYESWVKWKNTAALTPERMLWFRNYYLPDKEQQTHPDASPIYQKDSKVWAQLPDAWVGVAELDILRDEGELYARKLREAGKTVELVVYPASPHSIMAMDEALKVGYQLGEDAARALHKAFYGSSA